MYTKPELEKLRHAFRSQKHSAKKRGIEFQLTFEEWLTIWEKSGKLPERGRQGEQYVMARFGDKGPYAPHNVKIITKVDNAKEYKPTEEQSERKRLALTGRKLSSDHVEKIKLGWQKRRKQCSTSSP